MPTSPASCWNPKASRWCTARRSGFRPSSGFPMPPRTRCWKTPAAASSVSATALRDGMSDDGRPIKRVRWYDLIAPQAAGFGAPFLLLIALIVFWAGQGRAAGAVTQLQAWLGSFTGLNLLLDFSNLVILGMALWIVSRVTDPALPARFRPLSRQGAWIGLAAGLGGVAVSAARSEEHTSE